MSEKDPARLVDKLLSSYQGDNDFLLSIKHQRLELHRDLSVKQIDATLRAFARISEQEELCKRFWRGIVREAHPDRATDDGDRYWRNRFTVMANRAYESQDIAALVWLDALVVRPLSER